jgi:hypothetical protein
MNHQAGTVTHTNVSFLVDGALEQMFIRPPNPSYDYIYNSSVFAHDGLANTTHTLVISPNGGTKPSMFLFDYAVYTYVSRRRLGTLCADHAPVLRTHTHLHSLPHHRLLLPQARIHLNHTIHTLQDRTSWPSSVLLSGCWPRWRSGSSSSSAAG